MSREQARRPALLGRASMGLTNATFLDLQREAKTVNHASAYREWIFHVTGRAELAEIAGALALRLPCCNSVSRRFSSLALARLERSLLRVNPGFHADHLLTLHVFLSPVRYPERDSKSGIVLHDMLEGIRALPGMRSAAMVNSRPTSGGPKTDLVIEGRPAPPSGDEPGADFRRRMENSLSLMPPS